MPVDIADAVAAARILYKNKSEISHWGNCVVFSKGICTCGLLEVCNPHPSLRELYRRFDEQWAAHQQLVAALPDK
jgi:hypothetical protein